MTETVTRLVKTRMRHDGQRYRPGDPVELTPTQAAHHERRGHVDLPPAPKAPPAKEKPPAGK
ncbi:hypothetical protein [Roseospira goensis]|uniref:Uncharacterized protein n=1 Tax=Roseospira goensis TaxID=391922 RepID=A0A7W6WMG5_9PROT|nr:hypothetical protein [Roseospira goensis]MBB4287743.1 hypothetical protein [Roseospira goensis]